MSKTEWINNLQTVLNCPIEISVASVAQWNEVAKTFDSGHKEKAAIMPGDFFYNDKRIVFVCSVQNGQVEWLEVSSDNRTRTEMQLISLMISQLATEQLIKKKDKQSETEARAVQIGNWLLSQLESSDPIYSLPDHLVMGTRMYDEMIPFLLVLDQMVSGQVKYAELEKLLRSFLADDIVVIPLKEQEWLVFGPAALLRDDDEGYDLNEEESIEEGLASIAHGLHEMLASEWLGDCHLAISLPVTPANHMVEAVQLLRQTVNLGRKFNTQSSIHLPWLLHLERIVYAIPESQRVKFLEQSLKRSDLFVEPEMLATLDTFFMLDCNVSETAKRLYIHRNTLLYRLDKLKQETGLDVRLFRDAVLVKMILLLYKVTKRN